MASKSLGTLTVDLIAKTGGFERGMDAAERKSASTAKAIKRRQQQLADDLDKIYKAVGVAIVAAFAGAIAFSKKLVDANTQLYQLARQAEGLNVSVKFLSGMAEQADDLGVNLQQLSVVFGTLNRQIATAQRGSARAKGLFAEFGIDPNKAKSTEEVFLAIADSVQKYGLNARRAGELTQIFGASGKDIVPILQQGAAAIRANNDAMAKTGQIITDDNLPAITALYNAADSVGDRFTALRNNLVMSLAPALTKTLERVDDFVAGLDKQNVDAFAGSITTLANAFVTLSTNIVNGFKAIQAFGRYLAFRKTGFIDTDAPLKDQESQFNELLTRQQELQNKFDATGNAFVKSQLDQVTQQVKRAQDLFKAMQQLAHPGGAESAMTLSGKDVPDWMKAGLGAQPPTARPELQLLGKPTSDGGTKQADKDARSYQRTLADLQTQLHELDGIYNQNIASINGVTAAEQAFNERMDGANQLLEAGRINWEQYGNIAQDALQNLNDKAAETFDNLKALNDGLMQGMQFAFHSFVDDFSEGIANMLEGGKLGFKSILKSFLHMVEKMIIQWLILKAIMGIGGAMGGTANGTDFASFLYRGGQMPAGRAAGGPVSAGTTYLVGEKGPELFTPSAAGTITTNSQMRSSMGGNITVENHIVVNSGDGQDDSGNASAARALGNMIEAKTKEIIVRATQPGGILWKQRNGVTA